MKRKIFILSLIFTFLFANTGLPLTIHYCSMLKSASLSVCGMCKDTQPAKVKSCCEKKSPKLQLKNETKECCQNKIISGNINDGFVKLVSLNQDQLKQLPVAVLSTNNFYSVNFSFIKTKINYAWPPGANENPLYITTSSLLI